jgi:hypothetical protein
MMASDKPITEKREFIMRHPADHPDKPSFPISRENSCRCGRDFTQLRINPEWLNSPAWTEDRARFREAFEVTDNREVWIPKACPSCERKSLEEESKNG